MCVQTVMAAYLLELTQHQDVPKEFHSPLQFKVPGYVRSRAIWRHAICMRDAQRQAVARGAQGQMVVRQPLHTADRLPGLNGRIDGQPPQPAEAAGEASRMISSTCVGMLQRSI